MPPIKFNDEQLETLFVPSNSRSATLRPEQSTGPGDRPCNICSAIARATEAVIDVQQSDGLSPSSVGRGHAT